MAQFFTFMLISFSSSKESCDLISLLPCAKHKDTGSNEWSKQIPNQAVDMVKNAYDKHFLVITKTAVMIIISIAI